jgi:hypothetical protein
MLTVNVATCTCSFLANHTVGPCKRLRGSCIAGFRQVLWFAATGVAACGSTAHLLLSPAGPLELQPGCPSPFRQSCSCSAVDLICSMHLPTFDAFCTKQMFTSYAAAVWGHERHGRGGGCTCTDPVQTSCSCSLYINTVAAIILLQVCRA